MKICLSTAAWKNDKLEKRKPHCRNVLFSCFVEPDLFYVAEYFDIEHFALLKPIYKTNTGTEIREKRT